MSQPTLNEDLNVVANSNLEITYMDGDLNIIQALDDEPNDVGGLTSAELKAKFDESGNTIKKYINETLIPEILAADATEAARTAAENTRVSNENARISAEQTRAASETTRQNNEASRVAAEQARADENTGIVAQATAQANLASAAATSAGNSASAASASESAAASSASAAAGSASAALSSERNAKSSENSAKASETAAKSSETASKKSETSAKSWAEFAQAQAESVNVPAAEGVYNVVMQDRAVPSDRYALIVESGVLKLLCVKNTVNAATPTLIDNSSGTSWTLAVENGKLLIQEV